jgi:hypothetical protein
MASLVARRPLLRSVGAAFRSPGGGAATPPQSRGAAPGVGPRRTVSLLPLPFRHRPPMSGSAGGRARRTRSEPGDRGREASRTPYTAQSIEARRRNTELPGPRCSGPDTWCRRQKPASLGPGRQMGACRSAARETRRIRQGRGRLGGIGYRRTLDTTWCSDPRGCALQEHPKDGFSSAALPTTTVRTVSARMADHGPTFPA